MALIFLGKSKCPVCGKTLNENDEIIGLPAAIDDPANPLYPYFDAGFHKSCYENWDKKEEAQAIIKEEQKKYEESDYYKEMFAKYGKPNTNLI